MNESAGRARPGWRRDRMTALPSGRHLMPHAARSCCRRSAKTGLTVGDIAAFVMEPDLAPRIVAIPPALRMGLGTQLPSLLKSLAYTYQKGTWIRRNRRLSS